MRKILLLFAMMAVMISTAQVQIFNGTTDSVKINTTVTSPTTMIKDYPAKIVPAAQIWMDYKSGSSKAAVTGWMSLDGVRWDTIPGFYKLDTLESDFLIDWNWDSYESPLLTKYIKFTARGYDSTQVIIPKGFFAYKVVP